MAKQIQIPETLKADLPPNKWGKILASTPIVMAVIATMLAGLASSEMTKAQYDRSLAAQLQSKAGDQWSYFQAKKLRGAEARNSLDVDDGDTPRNVRASGDPKFVECAEETSEMADDNADEERESIFPPCPVRFEQQKSSANKKSSK